MTYDVVLTAEAEAAARNHLLQHYERGESQEDLCFAVWRPSTGRHRTTAVIDDIILPEREDRVLHRNASFRPLYLLRAIRQACDRSAGLAFMHSHPSSGWQGMSNADVVAERDHLSYPAGATGLPFVGLTIGMDGYWSARFWVRGDTRMIRRSCVKVRVVGARRYKIFFNDHIARRPRRRRVLRRTIDTWGTAVQADIARLNVGIVGLGSVGAIVAEGIARVGVGHVTLIDPDRVESHNLDRLLSATSRDVGKLKVRAASRMIRRHGTARRVQIRSLAVPVQDESGYRAALDCDVIFSCVDRPVPRDVLNYIAQAHLIPVVDGGVAVRATGSRGRVQFGSLARSSHYTLSSMSAMQRSVQFRAWLWSSLMDPWTIHRISQISQQVSRSEIKTCFPSV